MDWNWFFSAVSQSTAAIVGIFAAFIITKIVNNQQLFDTKTTAIDEHVNDSVKLQAQLGSRYFEWYNERIRDKEDWEFKNEIRDLILKFKHVDPEFYFIKLELSIFEDHRPILKLISDIIKDNMEEIKKKDEPPVGPLDKKYIGPDFSSITSFMARPNPEIARIRAETRGNVQREREAIDSILLQVDYQSKKNHILLKQVDGNPESSHLVNFSIVSILLLFYVGVIYPLSFLPHDSSFPLQLSISSFLNILFSLKGAILSAISIVFNAIVVVFLFTNVRLKYDHQSLERLNKYTEPKNYSKYIVYREENLDLLRKFGD